MPATAGEGRATAVARGRRPSTIPPGRGPGGARTVQPAGLRRDLGRRDRRRRGVSRRTFFRYYESKRDVVWGEFDAELARLGDQLRAAPADGR